MPDAPEIEVVRSETPKIVLERQPTSGAAAAVAPSENSMQQEQDHERERKRRDRQKKKNFPDPPKVQIGFEQSKKYKFLNLIFSHLKNDDYVSVKNIFDEYEPVDLGFVVN